MLSLTGICAEAVDREQLLRPLDAAQRVPADRNQPRSLASRQAPC